RIIAPLDPNERRRSFYRDNIDRWRMPSRSREIQPAGTRENAVIYVPFRPDPFLFPASLGACAAVRGGAKPMSFTRSIPSPFARRVGGVTAIDRLIGKPESRRYEFWNQTMIVQGGLKLSRTSQKLRRSLAV
ncbi:MAG: hypothetical protein ACI9NC_003799, partial [Verrucomicrobiales bacterium]